MSSQEETPRPSPSQSIDALLSVPVQTENDALNLLVQYLNVAQHRGVFSIAESSKIYDCIKVFQRAPLATTEPQNEVVNTGGSI